MPAWSVAAGRAALLAHLADVAGQPASIGQGTPKQELDLRVRAAQLIRCPPGQSVVNGRVQPKQQALTFAHGLTRLASLVERAGVDHLLGGLLAAQHYEEV